MSLSTWLSDRLGLTPVVLISPMSLQACRARIEGEIDGPLKVFANHSVIGRLRDNTLKAHKRISYKNSFQTWLTAELVEGRGETRILCRFSKHPFVVVFMALWIVLALVFGTVMFVTSAVSLMGLGNVPMRTPQTAWIGLAVPLAMPVFGYALWRLGLYFARDERQFLIDFLCRALSARPTPEIPATA